MALTPAALDPEKPQVVHPRLALPNLIRCQTSLNSDSTPHKPLLDLFYPLQYNRSKKEIPIHYSQFGVGTPCRFLFVKAVDEAAFV